MKYELLNKNRIIATFELHEEYGVETVKKISEFSNLPFWMDNLQDWLENRGAAKHRAFVKKLLSKMGADSISGFIALTNCLSLQDTFWVRTEGSPLEWKDVNLFSNDFSEVMTHLAFDGTGLYGERIRTTSPELTTDGAYDKCWVRRDGDIVLLKAGSSGARNAGLEPYSEYMASQVYEKICPGAVKYSIEKYRGRVVTSCNSFSSEICGYKPISLWLGNRHGIKDILETIEKYGFSTDIFRRMIAADAVCVNSDRHFGNFGFMVGNDTFNPLSLAPIFDYNMAFSPYAEKEDFNDYDVYIKSRGPATGGDYVPVAKSLLTPEIKSELIALKDLELTLPDWCSEEEKYPFPKERVAIMNQVKNVMIDRILGRAASFPFVNPKDHHVEEDIADDFGDR